MHLGAHVQGSMVRAGCRLDHLRVFFNAVENLSLRRDGLQCLLADPTLSCSEVPSSGHIHQMTALCCTSVLHSLLKISATISPSSSIRCWLPALPRAHPQVQLLHCLAATLCHPKRRENPLMLFSPLKPMCILYQLRICCSCSTNKRAALMRKQRRHTYHPTPIHSNTLVILLIGDANEH